MSNRFLKWLSKWWPWPVYTGTGITSEDSLRAMQDEFKEKFGRRLNRTTKKYQLQPQYAVYELVGYKPDPNSQDIIYTLEHCATGKEITVNQTVFEILFKIL